MPDVAFYTNSEVKGNETVHSVIERDAEMGTALLEELLWLFTCFVHRQANKSLYNASQNCDNTHRIGFEGVLTAVLADFKWFIKNSLVSNPVSWLFESMSEPNEKVLNVHDVIERFINCLPDDSSKDKISCSDSYKDWQSPLAEYLEMKNMVKNRRMNRNKALKEKQNLYRRLTEQQRQLEMEKDWKRRSIKQYKSTLQTLKQNLKLLEKSLTEAKDIEKPKRTIQAYQTQIGNTVDMMMNKLDDIASLTEIMKELSEGITRINQEREKLYNEIKNSKKRNSNAEENLLDYWLTRREAEEISRLADGAEAKQKTAFSTLALEYWDHITMMGEFKDFLDLLPIAMKKFVDSKESKDPNIALREYLNLDEIADSKLKPNVLEKQMVVKFLINFFGYQGLKQGEEVDAIKKMFFAIRNSIEARKKPDENQNPVLFRSDTIKDCIEEELLPIYDNFEGRDYDGTTMRTLLRDTCFTTGLCGNREF